IAHSPRRGYPTRGKIHHSGGCLKTLNVLLRPGPGQIVSLISCPFFLSAIALATRSISAAAWRDFINALTVFLLWVTRSIRILLITAPSRPTDSSAQLRRLLQPSSRSVASPASAPPEVRSFRVPGYPGIAEVLLRLKTRP